MLLGVGPSGGAIAVVAKGIKAHGVPQRLLTDNGAALNPSRRGTVGQLVTCVTRAGVEAITGKPYKPTTQAKNERFRQTLFRFLDKQPLAPSLEELQGQVDQFDQIHNAKCPHQGLPDLPHDSLIHCGGSAARSRRTSPLQAVTGKSGAADGPISRAGYEAAWR